MDRIYINFCNPWPKKKHKKKRLTYPRQLFSYQEFLKDGGEIWFKTDDDELFEESLEYFKLCGFTQKYLTRDLANSGFAENILTEHEKMFMEQGIPIKVFDCTKPWTHQSTAAGDSKGQRRAGKGEWQDESNL